MPFKGSNGPPKANPKNKMVKTKSPIPHIIKMERALKFRAALAQSAFSINRRFFLAWWIIREFRPTIRQNLIIPTRFLKNQYLKHLCVLCSFVPFVRKVWKLVKLSLCHRVFVWAFSFVNSVFLWLKKYPILRCPLLSFAVLCVTFFIFFWVSALLR